MFEAELAQSDALPNPMAFEKMAERSDFFPHGYAQCPVEIIYQHPRPVNGLRVKQAEKAAHAHGCFHDGLNTVVSEALFGLPAPAQCGRLPSILVENGGQYRIRTYDPCRVRTVLYR